TLAARYEYREFLESKACDVIMYDLTWCGGPSEAKKISDLADTYSIPTSPHTCGGPLLYLCSAHLGVALPNLLIMESNYWKYTHQYPYFVNNVPVPEGGHVRPPERPGIGAEIRPELFKSGDAIVETVARVSGTSPCAVRSDDTRRAARLADASVDPTEASYIPTDASVMGNARRSVGEPGLQWSDARGSASGAAGRGRRSRSSADC